MITYSSDYVVSSLCPVGSKWRVGASKSSWLKQITLPECSSSCSFLTLYFLGKPKVLKLLHFATEHRSAEILLSLAQLCQPLHSYWFLSYTHRSGITEYIISECQLLQIQQARFFPRFRSGEHSENVTSENAFPCPFLCFNTSERARLDLCCSPGQSTKDRMLHLFHNIICSLHPLPPAVLPVGRILIQTVQHLQSEKQWAALYWMPGN